LVDATVRASHQTGRWPEDFECLDIETARGIRQADLQSRTGLSYSMINELVHSETTV
jgi:hypothetical protein